ncbi:hypothetical protein IQ265_05805 [Nodosilinea sp. LEGE 06152]|uniref:hypothetical protein n=1 Tax=Nodosilinea sp. LEGE 06152 TaxID=2777966 RepID=UPI001881BF25|nr:hypothetical protein [Nodosilinea sp. LEGE 06152]MBE9156345.1 hypothetical protein [Nodosilinea sp. LEGE 06152]
MADDRDPTIRLQLDLLPDQPGLLAGLDTWLQLGLISESQVREIAQTRLSCDLPPELDPVAAPEPTLADTVNPFEETAGAVAGRAPITDFVPAAPAPPRQRSRQSRPTSRPTSRPEQGQKSAPTQPRSPSPTQQWLNRLMSELSVVWLLGLGVFLVVLSSAVLAATQWERFGAVGQYLVLLAYTLVFWAVGLWCHRRPNLQLTAKTLQMITLLLVPLNFWALDGLGVWRGGGLVVGAIATILLTLAALHVLRQQASTSLEQANALGLAYLHTGWALGSVPILAVYAGTLGSAAATIYDQRRRGVSPGLRWPTIAITAALGLLLARGLTTLPSYQFGQFGLAFGLYGATWVWLGQRRLRPKPQPAANLDASTSPAPAPETPIDRTSRWGIAIGRGLLWWGWLIALANWFLQAFGIGLLGLALRIQALGKLGKRRDLLVAYAIAVQLAFVGWELIPLSLRQSIMAPLVGWIGPDSSPDALLGISLFPYVVSMVALGDWYLRRGKLKLSHLSDGIALGTNALLTTISVLSGPVLVVNLIASTLTALVVTLRRALARWRIVVVYGLALVSILVAIGNYWPTLPLDRWLGVIVALATAALLLSKALPGLWGSSAWLYGVGLSAMTYALLWGYFIDDGFGFGLSWLGLVIPVVLALIGRHPASVLTTGIALPFTLGLPWTRLVGLSTATALTGVNSAFYRRPGVAFLAVAFALGWVYSSLADWVPSFPRHLADWGLVTVGLMAVLWGIWRFPQGALRESLPPAPLALERSSPPEHADNLPALATLYRVACDRWGHILAVGVLALSTAAISLYYLELRDPRPLIVAVLASFLVALGLRYWGNLRPVTIYLAGWGVELLVAGLLVDRYPAPVSLAVPTLGLGAIALIFAATTGRSRPILAAPLHTLTIAYAGLALALRCYTATAWTGWLVVAAALLILEVGRRTQTPLTRWLALGLLSVGWYELVIYQMLLGSGGEAADALLILAGVAALIMAVYRLLAGQLDRALGLPQTELIWAAHLHWLIGSLLMLGGGIGMGSGQATLGWLGLAIAAALLLYALSQGRLGESDPVQHAWVYAGLLELVGWFALGRSLFPALNVLDNWWGVVACAVAVPVYWVPWGTWSWPQRPWRVMAVGVPLAIAILTGGFDHIPTLWVLVGFYGWLAWHSYKIRISYLSVFYAAWAIWVWLETQSIDDSVAWVLPLGLALLYIAQVDPGLKLAERKEQRHWLRAIALALILLTALVTERWAGLPVGALALGAIAAGLLLRMRAPLYVGTLVFALNALNQLVLLNAAFPFIKWVVGIVVGIALIWAAADVERRRGQWLQLTQSWGQDLDQWQ